MGEMKAQRKGERKGERGRERKRNGSRTRDSSEGWRENALKVRLPYSGRFSLVQIFA